jgi:uncharacterized phiE125 gp8 family phage protein
MVLTEVSAPPAAALPVRAFAGHLRLGSGFADDGAEDAVLELCLRAAMAAIEARLSRALLARDFSWTVSRWREEASQGMPIAPVRGVASITLVEADGAETAVDPEAWSVLRDAERPRLVGRFGRSLPRIPRSGHAEIRFSAGFGEEWEAVPGDLRQAVFLLAAHFYENRAGGGGAVAGSMPFGVLVLLEAYRATRIGGGAA